MEGTSRSIESRFRFWFEATGSRFGLRNRIKWHGNVVMNANVHTERNSRWPTAISQCGTAYQMSWQSKWAASVAENACPEYYPYQRCGRRTTRLVSWSRDASSLRSACALRRQEFSRVSLDYPPPTRRSALLHRFRIYRVSLRDVNRPLLPAVTDIRSAYRSLPCEDPSVPSVNLTPPRMNIRVFAS